MPELARETISTGHGLLEGPLWHPTLGLLVSDADVGGVWGLSGTGLNIERVAHRRGIGGMALHSSGGLVVSGRNVAIRWIDDAEKPTVELLDRDPSRKMLAFNDLTTDAQGRVYVGSISFLSIHDLPNAPPPDGMIHRIDLDGSVTQVADGIRLTNGMGFSPDGRTFYCSDSLDHVVNAYDVDAKGGLGPARTFVKPPDGFPDGLALSQDGDVWLAVAEVGLVTRYDPDGTEKERFKFDAPLVTSLCFGGEDLDQLFVVTGSKGSVQGGCVYRLRVEVQGLARAAARCRLPDPD